MEKVLKLLQPKSPARESPIKCEGIFDRKTYQHSFYKVSSSSSIEEMMATKFQRITLSQNSKKHKGHGYSVNVNHSCLKNEIQPHEAKMIKCKIADMIKDNVNIRQKIVQQSKSNEIACNRSLKEKKNSYSAYITARKKILARQNPNDLDFNTYGRDRDQSMQEILMEIHHRQQELLKIDSQLPSALKIQVQYKSGEKNVCQQQDMRFDKLVYRPRLQLLKSRREIGLDIGFPQSKLQKPVIPEIKTPFIRKGFVTVVKRVKGQSQLMINNTKTHKNRPAAELQPDRTWCSFFAKFKDHRNITEQNIELFPEIQKIHLSKDQFGRYNTDDFNSKSISILHYDRGIIANIFGHNQKQKLEIASITKVMTCYLILNLADKFQIDIRKQKIMVSQRASKMPGTSARLCYADICSVYDLLHGMMLPSGNDAATALGQWGGKTIRKYTGLLRRLNSQQIESNNSKSINFLATLGKKKSNIRLFVHHMNRLAKHTRLTHTYFVNTHGLMNQKAHSCSYDVATLTYYAMNNPIFKEIVGKKLYKCKIFNRTFSHSKETTWENTNKLLGMDGFLGVKTGITPAAGPCLTSFFQIAHDQYLIISILKTKSCQMRFKETLNLLKATLQNLSQRTEKSKDYKTILQNIEDYAKLDSKEDDLEYLNDCQQSITSHSDKQDDDNMEV